jgi:DUF1009 family protein
MTEEAIGILAGGGQFPGLIARAARAAGRGVVICGFHGHTDPALADEADVCQFFHLGQLNRLLDFFHSHAVRRLCLAGAINKPRALDLRPDLRAARVVFSLRRKGDDSLLRAVLGELEKENFIVLSAADLVPSLRCPPGTLTRRAPAPPVWDDIRFAWPVAAGLGRHDIGQCLVVKQGMVLAVECLEGTDAALRRGSALGGGGCVAVKMAKPGQDERVDLPAVGLDTIRTLVDGAYAALAVQAGKTLFFDREAALALAERHKLAVVALPGDFSGGDPGAEASQGARPGNDSAPH